MKAYGNHFWVSDCNTEGMVSFDCGVASMFGQRQAAILVMNMHQYNMLVS
jgi:hypothetical protein